MTRTQRSCRVPAKGAALVVLAAVVMLGEAALVATTSGAATVWPAAVVKAVSKFEPKAERVIQAEAEFALLLDAIPKAGAACAQPLGRGPLASTLSKGMAPLLSDTHFAEQGELALYPLSRLFSSRAAKRQYVADLDAVGTQFDALLELGTAVQAVSHDISSGDCSTAMGLASLDAGTLTNAVAKLKSALQKLEFTYT